MWEQRAFCVVAFEAFSWPILVAIRRSLLPALELWHSAVDCSFAHRHRPRIVSRGALCEPVHARGCDSLRNVRCASMSRFAAAETIAQLIARVQSSAWRGHVDKMSFGKGALSLALPSTA